ncbi:MAG: hypothetical protein NDJ94_15355 [Vicinamibacteria bacterium]|nr:hypothetical protein [Vicinamibacteria bacterium]
MTADEAGPHGLMLEVQRRLENVYALPPQQPVTTFLVGSEQAAELPGARSRVLVTQPAADEIELGVVFEPELLRRLAADDPRTGLHGGNLGAFCTLTEEVSHFVYLAFCAGAGRSVTQLELELQAEVDKFLTAAFLLSLQREGAVSRHLREALFRRYTLAAGLSTDEAERYHVASALAFRYCGFLERAFLRPARLHDLLREARRFYRLGQREKLEKIAST